MDHPHNKKFFVTYNNVSGFDKLQSRLPNHNVYDVNNVKKDVKQYPKRVDSFVVVRKGQAGGAKPHVIVVSNSYDHQPADVPTIW